MSTVSLGHIFLYETMGTALLLLLGCGVVATAILKGSKGENGGWLLINFGWGLGVFVGVYVAFPTGAHLNPAVTVSQWMMGNISAKQALIYFCGEFLGAFIGAVLAWAAFREHFDAEADPGKKLGVFSTGPAIRTPVWNIITEIIATFVLIFWILMSGGTPASIGPLGVALVVVGIGASLGGPTGYAINPARDLGPRVAHALLPIKGKGSSDWSYSWIPVVAPVIGAILATLLFKATDAADLIKAVKA
ncbi:glycerol uptake facilitator protein [Nakamurella panacisegetis]|uniref:Glycerol uptake facilitator protein n=1 Tax=Nakamurella panacisegetis TaxID=1090615 RepID=A0A1H0PEW7_9ACTN|nr:MIP/aquaporin family protein [Nakamurella panacisegetis]SDP03189.1 glycerol uptake facilitator protein [Nakamurella panacisegetis]